MMIENRFHARPVNRLAMAAGCLIVAAAQGPAGAADIREPALARNADDADMQWGSCPAFMPPGCAVAVLHGDPSKPNADILFKVPGGSDIPLHTHTSAERMVLVAGELVVAYEGQAQARLVPGTYAYGPAGRPHGGRCASDVPCVLVVAFEGPVDAIPVATAKN